MLAPQGRSWQALYPRGESYQSLGLLLELHLGQASETPWVSSAKFALYLYEMQSWVNDQEEDFFHLFRNPLVNPGPED